jgi:hypothetical protein
MNRGVDNNIKKKYYQDGDVVDWSQMKSILDAQSVRKGKYEFLVTWNNSTTANDVWIIEDHFPTLMKHYLETFQKLHEELF